MSRSLQKVNVLIRAYFTVYNSSNVAVTGLVDGDFTKRLTKDAANSAEAVTVAEIANGRYTATFTPNATGAWSLDITQATHNPRGWKETWDVTTDGAWSGTPQTGDSFARLGAPAGASVSADVAAIPAAVGALTKDGLTLLEHQGVQSAVLAGKASGGPGGSVFRSVNDSANRVAMTADIDGDRSAVTVTA